MIWKGIKSLVNITTSSKKDININNQGRKITDPLQIAEQFSNHYVNVGLNIDKNIPFLCKNFHDFLRKINVNPATPHEVFDIILSYDIKKASGPNGIPIFILKIRNIHFSDILADIVILYRLLQVYSPIYVN